MLQSVAEVAILSVNLSSVLRNKSDVISAQPAFLQPKNGLLFPLWLVIKQMHIMNSEDKRLFVLIRDVIKITILARVRNRCSEYVRNQQE